LLPAGSETGDVCTGKLWRTTKSGNYDKSGSGKVKVLYARRDANCVFHNVGGQSIALRAGRGGLTWSQVEAWAELPYTGRKTLRYRLDDIQHLYNRGSTVPIFDRWTYKVADKGSGGTLTDTSGTTLGTAVRNGYTTTHTLYQNSKKLTAIVHWKKGTGNDISSACFGELLAYYGAMVAWAISAAAVELGPLEWIAIIGTTAVLFHEFLAVHAACDR
jgi:hypothetical protein